MQHWEDKQNTRGNDILGIAICIVVVALRYFDELKGAAQWIAGLMQ